MSNKLERDVKGLKEIILKAIEDDYKWNIVYVYATFFICFIGFYALTIHTGNLAIISFLLGSLINLIAVYALVENKKRYKRNINNLFSR